MKILQKNRNLSLNYQKQNEISKIKMKKLFNLKMKSSYKNKKYKNTNKLTNK